MTRRRIKSGKRTISSWNDGGVGYPSIRPSSHPGLIESRHNNQVREVAVFSPAAATNFPCAPWNKAGIAQSSIGSHGPNVESPLLTPIKITNNESRRWRTTRGCGAHRSAAFGVGEWWRWIQGVLRRESMFSGPPSGGWWDRMVRNPNGGWVVGYIVIALLPSGSVNWVQLMWSNWTSLVRAESTPMLSIGVV
jgi:hypothetical protein